MKTVKTFNITEEFIQGAISAERIKDSLYPCRLPHYRRWHFPSEGLWQAAKSTSGVRLRFETDAEAITLCFDPLLKAHNKVPKGHAFDVVIDNKICQVIYCKQGATGAVFDKIGRGLRVIELWLPPSTSVGLKEIRAKKASILRPIPDRRPMWVTWGSSITHCVRAGSAARTWSATVARKHNLNLLCLGFGGQCHLDPTVAMLIRDLPASYISMKLGINTVSSSLSQRTYGALVAAAIAIVREKHTHTPIALISPIANPPRESTPSPAGFTLEMMRSDMEMVCKSFVSAGDMNLYYVNGLDFFGKKEIIRYSDDKLHPGAEGIDLQAERFSKLVIPLLLGK
ncbi:MAG TPA: SGNH/GDSL hydrolase family protein [Victivallales bacterium]|nr:SGNH/GDSL hydrolase family protein [Victivallales bacterium]